eukprot:6973895-Alexandrium_andersonii.AAC.1
MAPPLPSSRGASFAGAFHRSSLVLHVHSLSDGQTDRQIDRSIGRWIDDAMDRWTEGWADG